MLNSSGFYPGNEPWKLVDGACHPTHTFNLVILCALPWVPATASVGLCLCSEAVCAGVLVAFVAATTAVATSLVRPWSGNRICEGVLLFGCGKYGWDGSLLPGMPPGQYWVTFDLGTTVAIDAFALWNDGRGGWDVRNFAIQTGASSTGGDAGWQNVANATNLVAKTSYGGLQVFDGFQAASRYWRWYITGTGGNQPWVKEVQFRKQEKNHALEDVEQR